MSNPDPIRRVAHIMLDALHACEMESESPDPDGSIVLLTLLELGQAAAVTYRWEETGQGREPRADISNLIAGYLAAVADLLHAVEDVVGHELDLTEVLARARELIDDGTDAED